MAALSTTRYVISHGHGVDISSDREAELLTLA